MKTKTNTQIVKEQCAESKEVVMELLRINEESYNKMFFELAVRWADKHANTPEGSSYLTSQVMFWGWWRVEYYRMEQEFLSCIHLDDQFRRFLYVQLKYGHKKEYSRDKMLSLYTDYMDHRMMDCTSGSKILELSFHEAVKQK